MALRGSFEHAIFTALIVVWGGTSALVLGAAALVLTLLPFFRRAWLRGLGVFLLATALACLTHVPGYIVGAILNERDIQATQAYCEGLIERIEAWEEVHGEYPSRLELVDANGPEALGIHPPFYGANEKQFWFSVMDPGAVLTTYEWNSSTRVWQEQD